MTNDEIESQPSRLVVYMNSLRESFDPIRKKMSRLRGPLRVLWVTLISLFVVRYLIKNASDIRETIRSYDVAILMLTLLTTLIGKLFLNFQARLTTHAVRSPISFRAMLWMYSISDMAKYVPGGIWNAVARVRMYTAEGMTPSQASRAFGLEKYWQLLGAFATGLMACSAVLHRQIFDSQASVIWLIVENFIIAVTWLFLSALGAHKIASQPMSIFMHVRSILEQLAMAVFLGGGLYFPLAAIDAHISPMLAIGAFSLGRAAGYLAIFAPAGIGVREVVTLWAIFPDSQIRDLVIIALGINRIMTLVSDVSGFVLAFLIRRLTNGPPFDDQLVIE